MKIFWRKPSRTKIEKLIGRCHDHDFTQANVGSTRGWNGDLFAVKPNAIVENGYLIQRRRSTVGSGVEAFERAVDALKQGKCFDLPWVDFFSRNGLAEGEIFCLVAHAFWLWPASLCRVIYAESQDDDQSRSYAVGLGTLPIHAATGEEKIAVVWDRKTNDVDLLIGSYSKPATWVSWFMVWYLRQQQNRFARDSVTRIKAICEQSSVID